MPSLFTPLEKEFLYGLRLKYRSGWLRRGIPWQQAESVQSHTLKVRAATGLYIDSANANNGSLRYDRQLAIDIATVHDFPELIAPDYTPHDKISADDKHQIERAALLPFTLSSEGRRIFDMWMTYEVQDTPESRLVFQLDKLDAGVQAIEYLKKGFSVEDFIPYTQKKLTDPKLSAIFEKLVSRGWRENAYRTYFQLLRSN